MIIGMFGLIGCGKNTAADYLVEQHGFVQMSWASSLKDAVSSVFGWDRDLLEGLTEESRRWREQFDPWWSQRLNRLISPRLILQEWGTEVCRNNFHQDIWIASLENRIRQISRDIVITDCRFENEAAAVKRMGGLTIRVVRGTDPAWVSLCRSNFKEFKMKYPQIHASEYSSIDLVYDTIIHNDSSIENLQQKISSLVEYHLVAR